MKSPAFQFYPADYLADEKTILMTLEEEGAYLRLLCHCWREGSIPSDPNLCAKLIGKGASTTVVRVVQGCFNHTTNDGARMVHPRLDQEREKQRAWKEKSSFGGRKSSEARKGASTTVQPPFQPNANIMSSSLSSSSSSIKREGDARAPEDDPPEIPSVEETITFGSMGAAVPESYCRHYHAKKTETNGWVKNQRLVLWKQEILRWWTNDRDTWKPKTISDKPKRGILDDCYADGTPISPPRP